MERFRLVAAAVILGAWLISSVVDGFNRTYDPPTGIGIAVGAVVTWLYVGARRNGKEG